MPNVLRRAEAASRNDKHKKRALSLSSPQLPAQVLDTMGKHWNVARKLWVTDAMVSQATTERRVERWREHIPSDGSACRPSAPPSRFPSFAEGATASGPVSCNTSSGVAATSHSTTNTTFETISNSAGRAPIELGPYCHISDVSRTEVDAASAAGSAHDDSRELVEVQTAKSHTVQRIPTGHPARAVVLSNSSENAVSTIPAPATPERPPRRLYPVPPARQLRRSPHNDVSGTPPVEAVGGSVNSEGNPADDNGPDEPRAVVAGEAPPLEVLQRSTFVPMSGSFRGPGVPGHLVLPVSPPARPPRSPNRPQGLRRQPTEPLRIITDVQLKSRSSSAGSHKRRASDESEGNDFKRTRP